MNLILATMLMPLAVLSSVPAVPAADLWVWVDRAVDGDTIRLRNDRLVRYAGIDAPEIDPL